jgi:hypothetical protein
MAAAPKPKLIEHLRKVFGCSHGLAPNRFAVKLLRHHNGVAWQHLCAQHIIAPVALVVIALPSARTKITPLTSAEPEMPAMAM